ncbi:MAG: cell envelope integrity protein TolA [Verrucomicrobiia bacterium]
MINHTNHRIVSSVLLVVAFALTGCGKSTPKSPPKQQVRDAVAAVLPPFLSLDSIELEPISTGPESVKVNFKAIVAPKEDLYQVDREVPGTPKVTLLKAVQAAGTKASLYGSLEARRMMDKWTLELTEIPVGLEQFGKPRGAFSAQSYVTGTDEANTALRQQAVNAELQEQAKKAALQRQERERIAREEQLEQTRMAAEEQRKKEAEQRKAEEEAVRQKLMLATVPGATYIGTISREKELQRIRLVFTEQKGFLVRAEVSNPDNSKQKQTFTGELVSNPKPERNRSVAYPIVMSPVGEGTSKGSGQYGFDTSFDYFYRVVSVPLKLRLTDTGLEGESDTTVLGWGLFTLRLQRQ